MCSCKTLCPYWEDIMPRKTCTNGQEKVVSLATKSAKLCCSRISTNGKYRLLPFSGFDVRSAAEFC
ncbi:hypothetical protein N7519_008564 [Penicillium mononematosum]|uniref:uncharacterized protein n=1 Tax=Penicillium mononematosum TaxID=268346 RepID=UPI00254765DC|nr:uncharacterized protein N7519_008564 [Penicillium mononematosum]KAJ6178103.1 hypothetical protein N7519_008564 [Penicillium mononematosum]